MDDIAVSFGSGRSLYEPTTPVIEPDLLSASKVALRHGIDPVVIPTTSLRGAKNELGSNGEAPEESDFADDDVYVSFEQGEEHTLGDFEDTVVSNTPGSDGDDEEDEDEDEDDAQSNEASSTSSGASPDDDNWPNAEGLLPSELHDPTGLLNAMDRMFDCFDGPRPRPDKRLTYSPQTTYEERSLLDGEDLEWEAAMQRDGMDWLFPCCDDSGLDKDFGNFLDDNSTAVEGDVVAPQYEKGCCDRHRSFQHSEEASLSDAVVLSAIEKNADVSRDHESSTTWKEFVANRTMMTESDTSTLELSIDSAAS